MIERSWSRFLHWMFLTTKKIHLPFHPHHRFSPLWVRTSRWPAWFSCKPGCQQTLRYISFYNYDWNISKGLTFKYFSCVCSCFIWSSKQQSSTRNDPTYFPRQKTSLRKPTIVLQYTGDECSYLCWSCHCAIVCSLCLFHAACFIQQQKPHIEKNSSKGC